MKHQLRELLKVPKGQRIAQHIYNMCRPYEHNVTINTYCDGKFEDNTFVGIDIFNIEDEEFIKLMENK